MRLLLALSLGAVLLGAAPARAQFQNHSLGLESGYMNLQGTRSGVQWGLPIELTGSLYVADHWDLVAETGVVIVHIPYLVAPNEAAFAISLGVRYLFMEEGFRPYVGADLGYTHIFGDTNLAPGTGPTTDLLQVGPNAGFDWFVSDSVSLGLKAKLNFHVGLQPGDFGTSFMGLARATTYF